MSSTETEKGIRTLDDANFGQRVSKRDLRDSFIPGGIRRRIAQRTNREDRTTEPFDVVIGADTVQTNDGRTVSTSQRRRELRRLQRM